MTRPAPTHDGPDLRRFLVRGGAWAVAARLAALAAAVVVQALVARLLPPAEVGAFFLLFSVVMVGRAVGGLGIGRTLVRRLGRTDTDDRPAARRELAAAWPLTLGGALAVAVLFVSALGAHLLEALGAPANPSLRALVALWALALVVEGVAAECFRGLRRIAHAAFFNGLATSTLLIVGLAVWHGLEPTWRPSLDAVVMVAAVAALLAAVAAVGRLARTVPSGGVRTTPVDRWRSLLRPSLPILGSTLIALIVDQAGLWMLGAWGRDASQLALFGTGQRLARLVSTPLLVANAVLPPVLARLYDRGDRATLSATLRFSATVTTAVAALGLLVLVLAATPLMGMVFGPFYRQAAPIAVLLACGQLLAVACGSCGLVLLMTGHQRSHLLMNLATLATLIAGGILLRGTLDAWRTTWIVLLAAIVQQVMCVLVVRRQVGVWSVVTVDPRRLRTAWQTIAGHRTDG